MSATALINNVTLLVTLCAAYSAVSHRFGRETPGAKLIFGLVFGTTAVLAMMTSWTLRPGVVFDGRSVVVGLAGAFGGPLTGSIAAVLACGYRLWMGGSGAWTGCGVIASSAILGIGFRVLRGRWSALSGLPGLFGFGLIVHAVMLAWMLALPGGEGSEVIRSVAAPVLVALPAATMVIGGVLLGDERRARAQSELTQSEARYRAVFQNSLDGILLTTPDGSIRAANPEACRLFGRDEAELTRVGRDGVVDPSDRVLATALAERDRSGRYRGEVRLVRKGGTSFPAEVSSVVFQEPSGERFTSMVVRDVSERKRAEEELRRSEQRYRRLAARIETLREEERTRLSRQVHDELGQLLTGIKMDLRRVEQQLDTCADDPRLNPAVERLVAAGELVDTMVATVQRIASELRPGILDKLGLPLALQYEAGRCEERYGIPCWCIVPDDVPALPPETATALFRILQEALANVARHARATAVEIELTADVSRVTLEIRDNGVGMARSDPSSPTSLGLLGMAERARQVRGDLDFLVRPGGGTIVRVTIPATAPPGR